MQTLYQWDFNAADEARALQFLRSNKNEFAPEFDDQGFMENLIKQVIAHQPKIDEFIAKYAPEWPIEQITMVDRNILRIGVYELIFSTDVPSKVAINEAIELAKSFGGQASGKFVNGVLGAIYKDLSKNNALKEQKQEAAKAKTKAEPAPAVENKSEKSGT